jgi:hypothetical protein
MEEQTDGLSNIVSGFQINAATPSLAPPPPSRAPAPARGAGSGGHGSGGHGHVLGHSHGGKPAGGARKPAARQPAMADAEDDWKEF